MDKTMQQLNEKVKEQPQEDKVSSKEFSSNKHPSDNVSISSFL